MSLAVKVRRIFSGILLIVVAAVTLEATAVIQFYFSQRVLREEASQRAQSQMETARMRILDIVNQAESAVRNSEWIAQWCLSRPDSLASVCRLIVQNNPVVVGSTVALVPGYNPRLPLFSPYVVRTGDGFDLRSLATEQYDYSSQEWFTQPVEKGEAYWSEPYLDEGGGDILMTTYSLPVKDYQGRQAAVVTADISLDWLTEVVEDLKVYPGARAFMYSRRGDVMVTTGDGDLSDGKKSTTFSAPVDRTGWTMTVVIPDAEIFGDIRKLAYLVIFLQLLGIAMILLILRSASKNESRYVKLHETQERMEGDLKIASAIQMSMIPKADSLGAVRKDLDMAASIIPAKEVGGDLYDFFIRDERLYFCIGDVSGKGIPASLVMAVTRSMFRTLAVRESSPASIVKSMNDSIVEMNENNMFITFFCGVLDLATGRLRYCNAGHNAPLILTDAIRTLDVQPNLPLGIIGGMAFAEQETTLRPDDALFLFTDGLTEAENVNHELFGEARVDAVLHCWRSAKEHLDAVTAAVDAFVGDAPRSDDLTMLFIHYVGKTPVKHLTLRSDLSTIPALTDFVREVAQEAGLESASLELAMEEAVSNVIEYAYPEGEKGLVEVSAAIEADALRFIVEDEGRAFDPTAKENPDITLGVEERPIGGLGIFLVRQIMDEVSYAREGNRNILTMIKKR